MAHVKIMLFLNRCTENDIAEALNASYMNHTVKARSQDTNSDWLRGTHRFVRKSYDELFLDSKKN